MGGKSRIAEPIAEILNKALEREGNGVFVSLFRGACSVETKIKAETRILNDKHQYLIAMWQALQNGWQPPDQVTEEDYKYIRAHLDEDRALAGFAGFGCSFGGKWGGGYARDADGRNFAQSAKRTLLRDIQDMTDVVFLCRDYREVETPDGAVVYADPPYANTTGFGLVGRFNQADFWAYMRELSRRCAVYISSEAAPEDFRSVWHKDVQRTVNRNTEARMVKTEHLFRFEG